MLPYSESSFQPLPAGDAGVSLTLTSLRQLVSQSQTSALVRAAVLDAVQEVPAKDGPGEVAAILEWVKDHVRYIQDPTEVELVQDPRYLLRSIQTEGWAAGDCDDLVGLLAAMLETAGYPTRFLVQAGPGESFSHILVEALVDGEWVPLDPTNYQAAPGWRPLAGVDREATERGRGMLGQDDFSDPGGGVLTSWFTPGDFPQEIVSAPSALAGDTSGQGASSGGISSFFSNLFSTGNVQTALALAERYGIARPVVGYDTSGKPIYSSTVLPLSGASAGYTALTQAGPLGIPWVGWILGGGLALIVFRPRRGKG